MHLFIIVLKLVYWVIKEFLREVFTLKIKVPLLFYGEGLLPEWADVDEFGTGHGKDGPGRQRDVQIVRVSALRTLLVLMPSISSHRLLCCLSFICMSTYVSLGV